MNVGLFLALAGFLLPLSLMLRIAAQLAMAGTPVRRPVQLARLILLALLAVPLLGKTPAVIYATVGHFDELGRSTADFMLTGLGLAQFGLMLAGVLACSVAGPTVVARLDPDAAEPAAAAVQWRRDLVVVAICLFLAWVAA